MLLPMMVKREEEKNKYYDDNVAERKNVLNDTN